MYFLTGLLTYCQWAVSFNSLYGKFDASCVLNDRIAGGCTQTAADNWLGVKTHSIPPFTATTPGTVHRCTLHAIAMHISLCKVFLACVVVTTRVTRVSGSECERGRQCADSRFYDLVRAGCVQCTLVHGTYMCNVHFVANPGSRTLLSTEIQIVIHNWHICIYAYIRVNVRHSHCQCHSARQWQNSQWF